jgi:carbamoyl-phosphate synthase large subunit
VLHWPLEVASPNVIEYLQGKRVDLVINIPKNYQEEELTNDYIIRRQAVEFGIPLMTNLQLAQRFVEALTRKRLDDLEVKSWSEYGDRGSAHLPLPSCRSDQDRGASLAGTLAT